MNKIKEVAQMLAQSLFCGRAGAERSWKKP